MSLPDLLPVSEAAERLSVNESRVRAMLASGRLEGTKLKSGWLVHGESIRRLERHRVPGGRQLAPPNAWAVLRLASGDPLAPARAREPWKLRRLLDRQGLSGLALRCEQRGDRHRFSAHPGVLRELAQASGLALTGASAASSHSLGLSSGDQLDAYVAAEALDELVRAYALEPAAEQRGNVILRVLPNGLWPFDGHSAPLAAVAIDLSEDPDSRSRRTGSALVARLDAECRWRNRSSG